MYLHVKNGFDVDASELLRNGNPNSFVVDIVKDAIDDGYKRLIQPSIEREIRSDLKLVGEDSSFDYRAKIATVNGIVNNIQDYKIENNVRENIQMLKLLKEGKLKKP